MPGGATSTASKPPSAAPTPVRREPSSPVPRAMPVSGSSRTSIAPATTSREQRSESDKSKPTAMPASTAHSTPARGTLASVVRTKTPAQGTPIRPAGTPPAGSPTTSSTMSTRAASEPGAKAPTSPAAEPSQVRFKRPASEPGAQPSAPPAAKAAAVETPQASKPEVVAAKPASEPMRRPHSDSVGDAIENLKAGTPSAAQGVSSAQDLEAVRKTFHEVAVAHVSQVRDVMLELRFGDADPTWLAATKPALSSLRAMAAQIELHELCTALDEFAAIIDAAVANRARIADEDKAELLRRYQSLIELIPQAFELDAERDRREPIIVEALLLQVDGVERPTMDKLFAVGLNRLAVLTEANAHDVVAVSGIRVALAEAIVQQFQTYRARTKAAVSVRDPAAELRELAELVKSLGTQNEDFSRAASAWSDDARARKRELRKQREQTFQRIKVSLARLGARDQLSTLERLPFQERVEKLAGYLSAQAQVR
ncbi:MAG TPA: hypothetical protein VIV11_07505 [Kofleriaceae bacterium]